MIFRSIEWDGPIDLANEVIGLFAGHGIKARLYEFEGQLMLAVQEHPE